MPDKDRDNQWKPRRWIILLVLVAATVGVFAGAGGAGATASPYADAVSVSNPLLYYRMADTGLPNTTTMFDTGPNHKNGIYLPFNGSITQSQPSAIAEASDFSVADNGTTAVAQVPNPGVLPSTDSKRTVEAWYKSSSLAPQNLVQWGSTTCGHFFELNVNKGDGRSPDTLQLNVACGEVDFTWQNTSFQDGNWHQIVFVYDPAAIPRYAAYADGTPLTLSNVSGAAADALSTDAGDLTIGASGCCLNLNGSIDELAIYGSALSAADVKGHYDVGNGTAGCTQSTDPVAANTCVTADVMEQISVSAPASIPFGQIAPGETKTAPADITVQKNTLDGGYQLAVFRTAFTPSDLSLGIGCRSETTNGVTRCTPPAPADDPQLSLQLGLTPTAVPTLGDGFSLPVGRRASGRSGVGNVADDTWNTLLSLQVPAGTTPGSYSSTVTFVAFVTP